MFKIALAAFTAAVVAMPALAQDAPAPFTGPRAEAIVGYDTVSTDTIGNGEGVVYGAQLGYDWHAGRTIFGIEAEVTDSTAKRRVSNVFVAGDSLRAEAGRDLYAGARIGFAVSPTAMLYAKGGYTNARSSGSYTSGTVNDSFSGNAEGWRAGAGLEYKLGGQTYLKGEYRYSRYDGLNDRHQAVGGIGIRF